MTALDIFRGCAALDEEIDSIRENDPLLGKLNFVNTA